jgi:hypothetical protein
MAINYLPFARKEIIVVPARKTDRVQTGGFAVTDLARFATGGTRRAILHDITVQQAAEEAYSQTPGLIRIRIGIDGRTYLTEDLYDYRVFCDQQLPLWSVWDWSCGKRTPYRLYPGQHMTVLMSRSINASARCTGMSIPLAAMFNGMKVKPGSLVGTKDGEPILLYGMKLPSCDEALMNDLMLLEPVRFQCPKDHPVDLYSVTLSEWSILTDDWPIYILDGNDRPIWDNRNYSQIINNVVSPISMGYGGLLLDPDETVRVELENGATTISDDVSVTVMYRGVLEVDDGR